MLDHMILTVSDAERSLAFYKAALKPLHIKFFMPYKGGIRPGRIFIRGRPQS
jgi:catechol 2,3-dioxygenase-like lactoylglutathione lyase family enzyme